LKKKQQQEQQQQQRQQQQQQRQQQQQQQNKDPHLEQSGADERRAPDGSGNGVAAAALKCNSSVDLMLPSRLDHLPLHSRNPISFQRVNHARIERISKPSARPDVFLIARIMQSIVISWRMGCQSRYPIDIFMHQLGVELIGELRAEMRSLMRRCASGLKSNSQLIMNRLINRMIRFGSYDR